MFSGGVHRTEQKEMSGGRRELDCAENGIDNVFLSKESFYGKLGWFWCNQILKRNLSEFLRDENSFESDLRENLILNSSRRNSSELLKEFVKFLLLMK